MSEALAEPRLDPAPRRLTTVVAADICGYSRLAEIDDDAAIRTVNFVRTAFEQVVARRRGRLFHTAGDGFLAEFPSAADGVLAALEFVADMKARDKLSPINPGAQVRAGVHAGDVIEQPGGDLLGHGVNVAARLQAEAEPNGVLVSLAVFNLVRGLQGAQFSRRGPLALRNIDEPVVAFDAENKTSSRLRLPNWRRLGGKTFQYVVVAVIAVAGAVAAAALGGWNPPAPAQNADIAQLNLAVERSGATTEIDRKRFRAIAEDLLRSGERINQDTFDLLLKGDLVAAHSTLWRRFEDSRGSLPERDQIRLLHQAGAIVFDADAEIAKRTYERIIDIDAKDFLAHERLGQLYYHQSASAASNWHFEQALAIAAAPEQNKARNPTAEEVMFAKINYAASLNVQQRYSDAAALLDEAAALAGRLGHDSLVSKVMTRKAHAQVKNSEFPAARKTLGAIMPMQERRGFDANLAISLGLLATMSYEEQDFAGARRNFMRSLDIERAAGRALGVADMLFFVGLTDLKLGDTGAAFRSFDQGLEVARENNFRNMTIKNLIGKSLAEQVMGKRTNSCATLARAAMLHTDEIKYVPMTIEVIRSIECPYPPLASVTVTSSQLVQARTP